MAPPPSSESSELNVSVPQSKTPAWLRLFGTEPEAGPRYVPKLATPREQGILFTVLATLLVVLTGFVSGLSSRYLASSTTGAGSVLMILAFLVGTLGGAVHSLASLSHYAGTGTLYTNWRLFYLSRPLVGGTVALFLYFTLASTLVTTAPAAAGATASPRQSELFATLAWSALAGLFSHRVLEKFRDLLNTLLPTIQPAAASKPPESEEIGSEVPSSPDSGEAAETVPPREEEPPKPPDSTQEDEG
jgi:hypothetical protein